MRAEPEAVARRDDVRREPRYHNGYKAQCTRGGVLALDFEHGVAPCSGENVHRVVLIDAGITQRDHSQLASHRLCAHSLRGIHPLQV